MTKNMLFGKTNNDVKILQEVLYNFGYYLPEEDEPVFSGRFDIVLRRSILDFQKENGLKVSGIVDNATLKLLNEFLSIDEGTVESDAETDTANVRTVSTQQENFLDLTLTATDTEDFVQQTTSDTESNNENTTSNSLNAFNILDRILNILAGNTVGQVESRFDIFKCFTNPKCYE